MLLSYTTSLPESQFVIRNFFYVAETYVGKFSNNLTLEIRPSVNHLLFCNAEQFVRRCLKIKCLSLLALRIAEKDEIYDLGVKVPCRSEVELYIASCHVQPMAVVHAECHFKKIGVAVILGDGSPRMPECIETIAVFFFHAHIPANFADTVVHVRIETAYGS